LKDLKEKATEFKKKRQATTSVALKRAKNARITSPPTTTKETDSTASLATVEAVVIVVTRPASPPPSKVKKAGTPSRSATPIGAKKKTGQPEDTEAGEGRQRTESVWNLAALGKAMKVV
jgi:hypothetical protein